MTFNAHSFWTLAHGLGFGALYLLGCSGLILEMLRFSDASALQQPSHRQQRFLQLFLITMVLLAWASVLSGTYIVYPWYRAVPPAGTKELAAFPQRLLMSNPATLRWHTLGMEWKEHVAWVVPIAMTMAASVFLRYGTQLRQHKPLRTAVLSFTTVSFLAAGVAGFLGAMINKAAPIQAEAPTLSVSHPGSGHGQ